MKTCEETLATLGFGIKRAQDWHFNKYFSDKEIQGNNYFKVRIVVILEGGRVFDWDKLPGGISGMATKFYFLIWMVIFSTFALYHWFNFHIFYPYLILQ